MGIDPAVAQSLPGAERDLEPGQIYEQYADFVWRSLQRCGVPAADLEDTLQDVFVVVHRKLAAFRGDSKMTTWLFGICLRVAKRQRRFARLRGFVMTRGGTEPADSGTPEQAFATHESNRRIERLLDCLPPMQRAVLTMFEIEQVGCQDIARLMGVPVGTVYSRLHSARARLRQEFEREARDRRGMW